MNLAPVILFDGECNLCTKSVQFILKRDKNKIFRFASLQSPAGQALLQRYGIAPTYNSMVLIINGKAYQKSGAVLRIAKYLNGLWPFFYVLLIVPRFIRDRLYNIIARNRYQWFGRSGSCMRMTPELKSRFIGATNP